MHIIKLTQKSIVQENILKIMNTLHLLCFLLFLALPIRLASKQYSGSFNEDYNGPFKVQETDEEDEFDEFLNLPNWESGGRKKDVSNVDAFGAVGDGVSDDTKVIDKIDGTIVAPDDPKVWDPDHPRMWLGYYNLSNVFFQGKGVIDGSGSKWWAASCKRNKSNPCIGAPTALTIDSSSRVRVRDLTVQNGQQMHFTIARSEIVRVSGVTVLAPGNSPNTDGIHVTTSKNVVLHNCVIGTGDDCISIVSHSSNIKMKNIYCGPGHGISIGSLGKNNSIGQVETVVLDNAFIRDTTNGLRIKTWQGGSGYVRAVRYENVKMENVSNPIIIDQFYCDSPTKCEDQASAVEVSEILYKNITGTSATRIAMKFACSETVPCSKIVLNNINLQSESEDGDEETYCNNASGSVHGHVHPSADCLLQNSEEEKSYEHNIRTEL
ncbi:probable polygalacturonase At1g80170 isoform X5 [Salvia hispanica]|uniref:probable polygalacturonase At1g80170 isoform X5 n=1 Tax=Salvia hispanica TaxID=49212 RepID=UPI00200930F0|nr:probable polygalacturonase At1g80170 isoform X5 [Salvia hispanica]XP_047963905.1 probable polygalacturonase At1g80170 isoform X5 [Salvia hispanica]